VVGCQNYDDQFDDLNSKISSLATTVDGLLSVQTSVSALSTKLDNLASTALTDSDLTGILTEVSAVKASVAALETTDVTGIETEVAGLNAEVDDIIAKLSELLTANAVINQNIRITSLAELSLAEDLISTGADDPNVTINGSLVINTTGSSDITGAANVARLNAVMAKIKVVMKTVTVTADEALAAASLQYIQGNLDIVGGKTGSLAAGGLTTVTGAMTISQDGDLLMPTLNSVAGGITINTTGVSVTSVDFSGLTEGAAITSAGKLELPEATSVKISGVLPAVVTAAKATTFSSNSTAAQTASTITIDGSTEFSLGSASFSGAVTITATGAVNLSGVTSAKRLTITSGGAVNLGGLTSIVSGTSVSATTVNLGAVTSIASSTVVTATDVTLSGLTLIDASAGLVTLTLNGPTSVSVPALATAGGDIIAADAATFAAVSLATSTGTIDVKAGATIHLKNLAATNTLVDFVNVANLKLTEQETSLIWNKAVKLVTLDYTGKKDATPNPGGQANSLTITSTLVSLTTLIIGDGGIGTLTVSASTLTELNTAGVIINTVVTRNPSLATFNFQHTHLDGDNATTVDLVGNPKILSVNLGTLSKVKHVNITGNVSLTTIAAPNTSVLAEPITTVTVTIQSNDTGGTYTAAVAGTETTPYQPATLTGETVTGFKGFIDAYVAAGNTTVTYSIEIDEADAAIAGDTAAQAAGTTQQLTNNNAYIDSAKELLLLTDHLLQQLYLHPLQFLRC
jgi:hypothetical protein